MRCLFEFVCLIVDCCVYVAVICVNMCWIGMSCLFCSVMSAVCVAAIARALI